MTKLFFVLAILAFMPPKDAPEDGDYFMLGTMENPTYGHFIYKNAKVYYGFDRKTGEAENSYETSRERAKELYDSAAKIKIYELKGLNVVQLSKDSTDYYHYIEYRRNGKMNKVYWDVSDTTEPSMSLSRFEGQMNSYW